MKCPDCHCTRVDLIQILRKSKKKVWKILGKKLQDKFSIERYRVRFACQNCHLEYSELVDRDSLHGRHREQFEERIQWG